MPGGRRRDLRPAWRAEALTSVGQKAACGGARVAILTERACRCGTGEDCEAGDGGRQMEVGRLHSGRR